VGQAGKYAKNFKSRFYTPLLKLTARRFKEFTLPGEAIRPTVPIL
jgi:hypothetical protein